MKRNLIALAVVMLFAQSAWSDGLQIQAQQLGQLEQRLHKATSVHHYAGSQLMATVAEKPGQAYILRSPMNVQRAEYLKSPGSFVEAGAPIVRLVGPEVHHYYTQYKIYERLYQQSFAHYRNNEVLFQKQSISAGTWLDISQRFYDIKLEYDEYQHFFEYVQLVDEASESIVLGAPVDGTVSYSATKSIDMGSNIARFIPASAMRLKIKMPMLDGEVPTSFRTKYCELELASIDKQIEGFFQTAWSQPIEDHCQLKLNEAVNVAPQYDVNAYLVNKQSIFNWQGDDYVFYKDQSDYIAVKVALLSATQDDYVVTSHHSLENRQVLVTSVSAAQGILMGLGE